MSISTPSPTPSVTHTQNGLSYSNSIYELIGLIFVLVLILVAAYYTSKFVGKLTMGQLKNSNFKVIDTYRISPNKFIQIVKIANKFVVISVGKDTINFITELEESEVLIKDGYAKEDMNFKQILEKLRNKTQ